MRKPTPERIAQKISDDYVSIYKFNEGDERETIKEIKKNIRHYGRNQIRPWKKRCMKAEKYIEKLEEMVTTSDNPELTKWRDKWIQEKEKNND